MKLHNRFLVVGVFCMLVILAYPVTMAQAEDPPVATFGVVFEIHGNDKTLFMTQEGLEYKPNQNFDVKSQKHDLAIGHPGNKLVVHIDDDTEILLGGEEAEISDDFIGLRVIATGRKVGSSLHADMIADISVINAPPDDFVSQKNFFGDYSPEIFAQLAAVQADTTSLCMGQIMDFASPYIKDFQGCAGGPSASDDINIPDIPFACPIVGCFVIDRFGYIAALAGWGFAFPFEFSVPESDLVYHVPSPVTVDIQPVAPPADTASFWGGFGIDFSINVDFCTITGCYDVGTFWLGLIPAMVHLADGAPPFSGDTLGVAEISCPDLGGIEIPDTPISLIAVYLCEDLEIQGAPFQSNVQGIGTSPYFNQNLNFDGDAHDLLMRPDSLAVGIDFSNFWYIPDLDVGLYFSLRLFNGNFEILKTPTIPMGSGPFAAITTPFPYPNSLMTVATDPLSPINDLRYLYQPTEVYFILDVQPAPTRLTILSPTTVMEGEPIEALLEEDYDGSPIAGQPILFDFGDVEMTAITNSSGIAQVFMPPGEYHLTASFAGNSYYLPSSDDKGPIFIFRPTTFAIWGGNPDGIQTDIVYNFWGSSWWKQVEAGEFDGDASFKGNVILLTEESWTNPPANAVKLPDTLPSHIGALVTTQVEMHGKNMLGDIAYWVVLEVIDYQDFKPNAGNEVWGIMKAVIAE